MTNEIDNKSEMIIMNSYKVSVIIPCYNVESIVNLFEAMFNSIVNQSFGIENIEVLMIDDCSTDGTSQILENLSKKYSSVKLIFLEENSGRPSIPRNVGIKNSTGEYIMFLDQDDQLELDCIEKLYDEMIRNNVDIVKSNFSILQNNNLLKHDNGNNEYLIVKPKSKELSSIYWAVWGSLYNHDFIIENDIYFPNEQAEDIFFLAECINNTNHNIILLNNYSGLIYSYENQQSLSQTFTIKQVFDYVDICSKVLDGFIKNHQNSLFIKNCLETFLITLLMGSFLRSKENNFNKKKMANQIHEFIVKYNDIPIDLPKHWIFCYKLFLNEHYRTLILISNFINFVFNQRWFIKFFRNQDYE